MEFLNWAGEHPWLFVFMLLAASSACHGLGRLGSTTTKIVKPSDED
ncbi:hypothetical protein [Bradyrhizobium cenepequi]